MDSQEYLSLTLTQNVHAKMIRMFGTSHKLTLFAARKVGRIFAKLDRLDEGLCYNKKLLQVHLELFGTNDEDTIYVLAILADVLRRLSRYEEARLELKQVYEWKKTNLGISDFDTLVTRLDLALLAKLQKKKNFKELRIEYRDILFLHNKISGVDQFKMLRLKKMLGFALVSIHDTEEGLRLLREVLISYEQLLGYNHAETLKLRIEINEKENWKVANSNLEYTYKYKRNGIYYSL